MVALLAYLLAVHRWFVWWITTPLLLDCICLPSEETVFPAASLVVTCNGFKKLETSGVKWLQTLLFCNEFSAYLIPCLDSIFLEALIIPRIDCNLKIRLENGNKTNQELN